MVEYKKINIELSDEAKVKNNLIDEYKEQIVKQSVVRNKDANLFGNALESNAGKLSVCAGTGAQSDFLTSWTTDIITQLAEAKAELTLIELANHKADIFNDQEMKTQMTLVQETRNKLASMDKDSKDYPLEKENLNKLMNTLLTIAGKKLPTTDLLSNIHCLCCSETITTAEQQQKSGHKIKVETINDKTVLTVFCHPQATVYKTYFGALPTSPVL